MAPSQPTHQTIDSSPPPAQGETDMLADLEAFRSALEASQIGVWSWDLRSNFITWSINFESDQGAPDHKADGTIYVMPQSLPKHDDPGLFAVMKKALESRAPARVEREGGDRWRRLTYRLRCSGTGPSARQSTVS